VTRAGVYLAVAAGLVAGLCIAEEPALGDPLAASSDAGPYDLTVAHLCADGEYLACLEASPEECHRDLQATDVKACAGKPYIVAYLNPEAGMKAAHPIVPVDLVECVYAAHVQLRGLDQLQVNACMAQAKLVR
jgi:hypothetical protein